MSGHKHIHKVLLNSGNTIKDLERKLSACEAQLALAREGLEKIAEELIRVEYRGEDNARCEVSPAARIAKSTLSKLSEEK